MEDKRKRILDRLTSDYLLLQDMGYIVVGVFLQGSQNYELDYEASDIDSKAIVLPSFKDFILNKKPVSTTHILPSNEHVDIKDIRLMFECFKKQNFNFLEILFTKYYVLNPVFAKLYQPMLDNAEMIAHYNNYAAVNCIAGMVFEKKAALCHPYPSLKERIEKYGYDRKQLHHILRCEEFLYRYCKGVPYRNCLIPQHSEYLKKIKSDPECYSLKEAIELSDTSVQNVKAFKDKYMKEHPVVVNKEVETLLENVLYNILKASFQEEITKE